MEDFTKASQTFYKKPESGSKQDNFTKDDIKKQLKGFIRIKPEDLQHIEMGTNIKYFNIKAKKFRCGGYLSKVSYPDYIMLKNYRQKLLWSVQIKDNYFFVPEDKYKKEDVTNNAQKDRLFELYKEGKLVLKD